MVAVCVGILGSIPLVSAAPDLTLDAEDRFQEELVESDFDSELYAGGGGEIPGDGIFSEGKFQLSPDDIQVHQHKIPNSEDMSSLDSNNPLFPNGDNVVEQQEEKERMEEKDVFAGSDKGSHNFFEFVTNHLLLITIQFAFKWVLISFPMYLYLEVTNFATFSFPNILFYLTKEYT